MRIFYDRYTSAKHADAHLIAADALTMSAAIFFATAMLHREGGTLDAVLLAAWCLLPHVMTRHIRAREWPRDFRPSMAYAMGLVIFIALSAAAGWTIVTKATEGDLSIAFGTLGLVVACWCSGFLLFLPPTYRLFDALCGGVMLLGYIERQPHPVGYTVAYAAGLLLSAPARHQLFDVFASSRRPRLNLQNVRAAALIAAMLILPMFALLFRGLYPLVDGPHLAAQDAAAEGAAAAGSARGRIGARAADDGVRDRPQPGDIAPRTIGYSSDMRLSDLSKPRRDDRVVLRVRLLDDRGRSLRPSQTRAWPGSQLWRGISYSVFDAGERGWRQHRPGFKRRAWRRDRTTRRRVSFDSREALTAEVEIVERVFANLMFPYVTGILGPVTPTGEPWFYGNAAGDVVPSPRLDVGTRYRLRFQPTRPGLDTLPDSRGSRPHPDREHLLLPSPEEVGIDLRRLGHDVFGDARSLRDKVSRLRHFFEGRFRYNDDVVWNASADRLALFLEETHAGDCVYFATATALLLRTAGVSTRIVAGYNRWEWNEPESCYQIRNSSAHAWIEVFATNHGWHPIDPTTWVPRDTDAAAPGEALDDRDPGHDVARLVILVATSLALTLLIHAFRRPRRVPRPRGGTAAEEDEPLGDEMPVPSSRSATTPREELVLAYHRLQSSLTPSRRHRRASQTPREHASVHAGAHDELDAALDEVNQALYETLYGPDDPTATAAARFKQRCRTIRRHLG